MMKAFTEEWFFSHRNKLNDLIAVLQEHESWKEFTFTGGVQSTAKLMVPVNAFKLWKSAVGSAGRAPLPLLVDCFYVCAKLSGNRVGIKAIKRATKELWGRKIEVLPLDKRRENRRWIWAWKREVLELYPDEPAWDDLVSAWKDKVVDEAYFQEEE